MFSSVKQVEMVYPRLYLPYVVEKRIQKILKSKKRESSKIYLIIKEMEGVYSWVPDWDLKEDVSKIIDMVQYYEVNGCEDALI
mgnify:CR=1 FL=1